MQLRLLTLSILSTVLACAEQDASDPFRPAALRARIADDLHHVLTEAEAAAERSTRDLPTGSVLAFASGALERTGLAAFLPLAELVDDDAALDPASVIATLNQQLFTDANHLGDGIFGVPASLVCGEPVDEACGDAVAKIDLRVRVEDGADLRFWLQVNPQHDEPLAFVLRPDELAVTLDLDDASDLNGALDVALAGELSGSLKIVGPAHAVAALSIVRPLSIELAGPDAFRLTSAAAPVVALHLDGGAANGAFDLALGETRAHLPGDDAPTDVVLAGATVNATFQAHLLRLANLSLGRKPSTVTVPGRHVYTVDLSPYTGGTSDASITFDPATGRETLTVTNRFDLRTMYEPTVASDEPRAYLALMLYLEGALRSSPLADHVEVLSGAFQIIAWATDLGFQAKAGDCVFATEQVDEAMPAPWTSYAAGACPLAR